MLATHAVVTAGETCSDIAHYFDLGTQVAIIKRDKGYLLCQDVNSPYATAQWLTINDIRKLP